jgi:hypothetical protein
VNANIDLDLLAADIADVLNGQDYTAHPAGGVGASTIRRVIEKFLDDVVEQDVVDTERRAVREEYTAGVTRVIVRTLNADWTLDRGVTDRVDQWVILSAAGEKIGGVRNLGASGWAGYVVDSDASDTHTKVGQGWQRTRVEAVAEVVKVWRDRARWMQFGDLVVRLEGDRLRGQYQVYVEGYDANYDIGLVWPADESTGAWKAHPYLAHQSAGDVVDAIGLSDAVLKLVQEYLRRAGMTTDVTPAESILVEGRRFGLIPLDGVDGADQAYIVLYRGEQIGTAQRAGTVWWAHATGMSEHDSFTGGPTVASAVRQLIALTLKGN